MTEFGKSKLLSTNALEELGYSIVIYPATANFISKFANKLCRILLNMPFYEFTTSFRAYNHKCLKILNKSDAFILYISVRFLSLLIGKYPGSVVIST